MPLSIDFFWILVSFGRPVGKENRTEIDQKSNQKGSKQIKKRLRLGCPWEAVRKERALAARPAPPSFTNFQRPRTQSNNPDNQQRYKEQRINCHCTATRRRAVADIENAISAICFFSALLLFYGPCFFKKTRTGANRSGFLMKNPVARLKNNM